MQSQYFYNYIPKTCLLKTKYLYVVVRYILYHWMSRFGKKKSDLFVNMYRSTIHTVENFISTLHCIRAFYIYNPINSIISN